MSVAAVRRLPGPNTDVWDWQMRGACREMDSAVFFHPDRERGPARDLRDQRAKAVCRTCPVIEQCLRHALQVQEPYGVWGGLTAAERAAAARDGRNSPDPEIAHSSVRVSAPGEWCGNAQEQPHP